MTYQIHLSKVFGFLALVACAIPCSAFADTINVNITSGNGPNTGVTLDGTAAVGVVDTEGTTWNDLGGVNSADLLFGDGSSSGIGVSVTDAGGNANAGFTFSQNDGLAAGTADVLDNYLAANDGFGANPVSDLTFTFTGLDTTATYNFHFISVGDTAGQGGSFTIGGTTLTTSGASPTGPLASGDNFVSFNGISAAGGTLDVVFGAGPGNTSFAALSGFQVVEVAAIPEPGSVALISVLALSATTLRRRKS